MILYSLACDAGHRFDSWFRDSAAFEEQGRRGLVRCPTCASSGVTKTIMAPAVVGTRPPATERDSTASSPIRPGTDRALLDPELRQLRTLLKAVRDEVVGEGVDVGARFPEEARRIHHGEAPVRQIYGKASVAEARDLIDDGIMVLPIPTVADDLN